LLSREGSSVSVKVKADPEVGDVYRVTPATSPFGDAHGQRRRPVGVVQLDPNVSKTLTRTTHPKPGCRVLESAANARLGLEAGAWTDHRPRPIPNHWFGTSECEFMGPLDADERRDLVRFWETTKMLGRA
jgi:hypothetical protein